MVFQDLEVVQVGLASGGYVLMQDLTPTFLDAEQLKYRVRAEKRWLSSVNQIGAVMLALLTTAG